MKLYLLWFILGCFYTDTVETDMQMAKPLLSLKFKEANTTVTSTRASNVTLPCEVEPDRNETYRKLICKWQNHITWSDPIGNTVTNGTETISLDKRFQVIHSADHVWNLLITNAQTWDSGEYLCMVSPWDSVAVNLTVSDIGDNDQPLGNVAPNPTTTTTASSTSTTTTPSSTSTTTTASSTSTTTTASSTSTTTTASSTSTTQTMGPSPTMLQSVRTDPNSCSVARPCENNGTCNAFGQCVCLLTYEGFAYILTDSCDPKGMINCTVTVDQGTNSQKFTCNCKDTYMGPRCETFNYCSSNPCLNNGVCKPYENFRCECNTGDPSANCSLNEMDECKTRPPAGGNNYIACIDYIGRSELICAPGYTDKENGCGDEEDLKLYCDRHQCQDEGYCKAYCNVDVCNGTENCKFTADPFGSPAFTNNQDCVKAFANGYNETACNTKETLYDGFDPIFSALKDCSPYFDTICTQDFGNTTCNSVCNNTDCLYDGFDCHYDQYWDKLPGVIVLELTDRTDRTDTKPINKALSLMMRSRVEEMIEIEREFSNPETSVMSIRIDNTTFNDIEYAGQFLAAMIGKRPEWLDAHVKDVYVCDAGMYSEKNVDKCSKNCSTCIQQGNICNWTTGACLYGCKPKHRGKMCQPCDTCIDQGDVCNVTNGMCLFGCLPKHWGNECEKCSENCLQTGDVCHNETGHCTSCEVGKFGSLCEQTCDNSCIGACDLVTGACKCGKQKYWHKDESKCKTCSTACKDGNCDDNTGDCECISGYHGKQCDVTCNANCKNNTCDVNGHCVEGCNEGFYGSTCTTACPQACMSCSVDGACHGECKPGYTGSSCEGQRSAEGEATDNTGVIVGLIIAIMLIVIIICVAFCYWRRRQSGDFIIEDEENNPPEKNTNHIVTSASSGLQPTSPLLGKSGDMIDMDEVNQTVIYAGPSSDEQSADSQVLVTSGDQQKVGEKPSDEERPTSDSSSIPEEGDKKRCTSSIVIEVGNNGRLLSISDGDETQSPTAVSGGPGIGTIEDVENEESEEDDDNAFVEPPPQSPLSDSKAPLASEEDLLSSLGPKTSDFNESDQPAGLVNDDEKTTADSESKRSSKRSNSTSSSSSKSSKSSKSNKSDNDSEKITEM